MSLGSSALNPELQEVCATSGYSHSKDQPPFPPEVQQTPPCFLSSWAHRAETLNVVPSGSSGRIISVYSATVQSWGGLEMEPLSAPPGA